MTSESDAFEKVLGSVGRLRVVRFLAENPRIEDSLTVYRLRALTGMGEDDLKRHLGLLLRYGLVKEVRVGNQAKYSLDRDNQVVSALLELSKAFEKASFLT